MDLIEIAVIGGGPSGLMAAREAARRGIKVVVFEEHEEIGEPERCAGLLSIKGLEKLSVKISKEYLQNIVRGASFITPLGRRYLIDAGRSVAVVVDRKEFDKALAEQAESAGAEIMRGTRVKSVTRAGSRFVLRTTRGEFQSLWIIDAEGAGASLLRKFSGKSAEPGKWIPIIQLLVEGHGLDERYAYLYFKNYLPDFFGYLIPIDDRLGKLGAASRTPDLRRRLVKFIAEEFPRVKILKKISYAIYTGSPITDLNFRERFIPVGDAAGHVKATTGGGVIFGGMIAGGIASAIAEIIREGDPASFLREVGKAMAELRKIAVARKLIERIPKAVYDPVLGLASSSLIKPYLTRFWDMDFQVSTFLKPRTR